MAIERAIYPVTPPQQGAPIDIEVEDDALPSSTMMTDDGGAVVAFGDEPEDEIPFNANLADHMDDKELNRLAQDLITDFRADKESRKDWEKTYKEGLDLLGLKFENRTEPWDGACGVFHPMLADSVVRFQAQTIQEIFPASGPVKVSVVGKTTNDKAKQANRVLEYMNYVATKEMVEYRTETEKLLFSLPLAGSAFRKVYHDPNLGRPVSLFVPADDIVVSYGASDLSTAPRVTHIMKRTENEVRKYQVSGFYSDIDLEEPSPDYSEIKEKEDKLTGQTPAIESDTRHTLLEMQVEVDLKGFEDKKNGENTKIALPYVVTIEYGSQKVLSIRRNWLEDDEKRLKRDHVVHYIYLPGFGFYGFGLIHMIGGLSKSATSVLRQLVDAGTLANLPGGMKTRGLRIKGDDSPILPGEFRDVDVPSGTIRDNITFLPYKEPSQVLYQLLGDLVNEGRMFASAADVKASDMNGEAPVGTTLAIMERELKVLSAIQARVHASMGKEVALLAKVIKDFGPEKYPYEVEGNHTIAEDFDDRVDITPVSDPNASTMAMRIMQGQAALQLSSTAPQMYDLPLLHRQMLETMGLQDAEKIVPTDEDLKPTDPVTEFMNMMNGKPVKAFMYQDHEAHIKAHMAAAQNPQIMELMAQNPQAGAVQAAAMAHLAEHIGFLYRKKIEEELGVQLPHPDEPLPDDIELRLSRLVAPAAAQLTGKAQQQKQAEENAAKQEDPIIQMQQKELEIKDKQVEANKQIGLARAAGSMQETMAKLEFEREKLQQAGMIEGVKLLTDIILDAQNQEISMAESASAEEQQAYKLGLDTALKLLQIQATKQKASKPNG